MNKRVPWRQTGVTLIEVMVSLVIGLLIIGAMIATYAGTSRANKVAVAQAEMNEDAQYALRLISRQVQMAGYNPRDAETGARNPMPAFAVVACSTGFATPTLATNALTCNPAASGAGEAIALSFEADAFSTISTVSTGSATSCIGNSIPMQAAGHYVAENRLYVKNSQLMCAAPCATAQPLVEGVETVTFVFGVQAPTGGSPVAGYLTADQLGPPDAPAAAGVHPALAGLAPDARWALVTTARICIVMRSRMPVFDSPVLRYDCNGADAGASRHLERAYVATAAIRNRIGL